MPWWSFHQNASTKSIFIFIQKYPMSPRKYIDSIYAVVTGNPRDELMKEN